MVKWPKNYRLLDSVQSEIVERDYIRCVGKAALSENPTVWGRGNFCRVPLHILIIVSLERPVARWISLFERPESDTNFLMIVF